jgi:hypothetical protein
MGGQVGVVDSRPAPASASAGASRRDSAETLGAVFFIELPASGTAPPIWALHVDRDLDARVRVADLLTGTCRVESVPDLAAARGVLHQPALRLVIADPRSQDIGADDFCAGLRDLAPGVPLLLYSDAVDADYAARHAARWLAPARSDNHALVAEVRAALAQPFGRRKTDR